MSHNYNYVYLCKDCGATAEEVDDGYVSSICSKAPQSNKHKLRLRKLRSNARKERKILLIAMENKLQLI